MKVLQLTAHFRPNIGGVETHLDDLVKALIKHDWLVTVLTYRPLTARSNWKIYEGSANLSIIRIPWIPNLFYSLVSLPLFEFLYLVPGLFLFTPFILIIVNPDVVHAHGLVAGFVAVFWSKIFNKKVVISTHSIYSFPEKSFYKSFVTWIFKNAQFCLGLSKQAASEILSLGIDKNKVSNFTYWIDLENFTKVKNAKVSLGWDKKFVVLFVGRLISEKGLEILLESAKSWHEGIELKIIGTGPLEDLVIETVSKQKNIEYLGVVTQNKLPEYYSASDILIVPSASEEGFGRVIIEALACGTPVIGSNRGAISEAINNKVGRLIDISVESIKNNVEDFYNNNDKLVNLAKNCRNLAERRYSEKNIETIINTYTK